MLLQANQIRLSEIIETDKVSLYDRRKKSSKFMQHSIKATNWCRNIFHQQFPVTEFLVRQITITGVSKQCLKLMDWKRVRKGIFDDII